MNENFGGSPSANDGSSSGSPLDDGYGRPLTEAEKADFKAKYVGQSPMPRGLFVVTSGVYGANRWASGITGAMQARNGDASPYYQNQGKYTGKLWYENTTVDNINNGNTTAGITTGFVSSGYGHSSTNVFKYAQRFGNVMYSAKELTEMNAVRALKISNVVGGFGVAFGFLGAAYSYGRFASDISNGRQPRGKDFMDGTVGFVGSGIGTAALLGMVSNPIGWGVGVGVSIYFGARFVYDLNHP